MLRYSDQPIFDILSLAPIRFDVRSRNHSNDDQFKLLLETCISTLAIQAAGSREQSKKFATWKQNLSSSDSEMMYGLVQCTPDLSAADYSNVTAVETLPLPPPSPLPSGTPDQPPFHY
ncbi:hypothetical protein G4B88_019772 [Cannabis sativa]|uniref:Uncharacterized protein n=1 Tax=Cannabis sativa TaxID=3483 RepID=A0A7J6HT63_CANSA|nr:hypothetical protein G4B88_019772 [Cannabis sativa]